MMRRDCEVIIDSPDRLTCGRPACMKLQGVWMCAEHWDKFIVHFPVKNKGGA